MKLATVLFILLIAGTVPGAEAKMYIVDDDGFAQYDSINEAVFAAGDGDTLYVKPGIYKEHILLDKSLTIMPLRGEEGSIFLEYDGNPFGIKVQADGCVIEGLTITNFTGPGIYVNSDGNDIRDNLFINDLHAVFLNSSSQNTIEDNLARRCLCGIVLQNSAENTIKNNQAVDGVYNADRLISAAILLHSSDNNTITSNSAARWHRGIVLHVQSSSNLLEDNLVSDGVYGLWMNDSCEDNEIKRCRFANTTNAIELRVCTGNLIRDNQLKDIDHGIRILTSPGNLIINNQLDDIDHGIWISDSSANVLEENALTDVVLGLYVDGDSENSFRNQIAESNTMDGKPVLYYYDRSGVRVEGRECAQLTLAYCDNFTVQENVITNDALFLYGSRDNLIRNNDISNCYGMYIHDSSHNIIEGNLACKNRFSGIFLVDSSSNRIDENTVSQNNKNGISLSGSNANQIRENVIESNLDKGIILISSNENDIVENVIVNNSLGISIKESRANEVYHNNLIDNLKQASDDGSDNSWDRGPLTGGNHWSDHICTGDPCYDRPREIGEETADNYPFQSRDGWSPGRNIFEAAERGGDHGEEEV